MNRIKIEFDAISENEAFARVCIAAFVTRLDPTLDEINDVKTAVSEAVTNAIIHGYDEQGGTVLMEGTPEEIVANEEVRKVYLGDNFSM